MSTQPQKLQSWWAHRQGLLEREALPPSKVFETYGWTRSVGGCNPYLAAFARAGTRREQLDEAVKRLDVSELPAARGCTYVVSQPDFAIALSCGNTGLDSQDMRTARALGATDEEIQALREGVARALEGGALDPAGLKAKLGPLVRNFGEAGKKKGLTTSLPIALGVLQAQGRIVRRPISGRLDEQRYAYELWRDNPPAASNMSRESALAGLGERFFRWAGSATLQDFAAFAGVSMKTAKAATEHLELQKQIEEGDLVATAADREEFDAHVRPEHPSYRFVNAMDPIFHFRQDLSVFTDERDLSKIETLSHVTSRGGGLRELAYNAILDRGAIVGLWEFDPEEKKVVYRLFRASDPGFQTELSTVESFIADQLGDARTFSLDTPASRKPKLDRLRTAS